jgi:hypothetical protein
MTTLRGGGEAEGDAMVRKLLLFAAVGTGLLGAGCQPEPFSISFTVDRTVVVESEPVSWDPNRVVTHVQFTGWSRCTRSEPLDVWPTITQHDPEFGRTITATPSERSIPCGTEWRRWSEVFDFYGDDQFPQPVPSTDEFDARLSAHACTNPGEPIDEDCVTFERAINVVAGDVPDNQ